MGALTWAQRRSGEPLKRVFNTDIAMYSLCGGTLRIIAEITDPDVIQKILYHMRGPTFTVFEVSTSDGSGGFDDFVFGGYNDKSWDASLNGYRVDNDDADREDFIFNLTTAIKLDQCLSTDPECGANDGNVGYLANQDQRTYGATFGGVTIYT